MGNPEQLRITLISLLLSLPVIMFALSFHETAHGYVAYRCGDPTAHNLGRLTLNPVRHLDPIGFLCMLIFGFGWAKPVPINTRYFKNPKRGMILTALAGPLSNLLLGFVNSILAGLFFVLEFTNDNVVLTVFYLLFFYGALMNYMLMFFNLIPIPPFDGSRIALGVLPEKTYFNLMRHERTLMWIILGVLLVCDYLFNVSPFSIAANWLANLTINPFVNLFAKILL